MRTLMNRVVLAYVIFAGVAAGQEKGPWVGTRVVTKYEKPLKVGGMIIDRGTTFRIYTVEKSNGGDLWLVSGNIKGWVSVSDVVPFQDALHFYGEEIQINPKRSAPYVFRACLWVEFGEMDLAIRDLTQAIRIAPRCSLFEKRGALLCEKKEYENAIADYNEVIRLDPENAGVYNYRGDVWYKKKEYDKAIADYAEALRFGAKVAPVYCHRGDAWQAKGDHDRAIADYSEAIRIDESSTLAYTGRGSSWGKKKENERAIADFTEAIRLGSMGAIPLQKAFPLICRAGIWLEMKQYDQAIADFSEAIRLDSLETLPYIGRGYAWFRKKDYEHALGDFNEAIRLDPKDALAYTGRGKAWSGKKDYERALRDFSEAVRLDSDDYECYENQAWLWATCPDSKLRDGKRAVVAATKACDLSSWKKSKAIDTLAAAHAELGNFDQAIRREQEAIAKEHPESDEAKEYQERLNRYRDKKSYRQPD